MIHVRVNASDRCTIIGANGSGKSTLAAYLIAHFRDDYPNGRVLISDTKPRWRADKTTDGRSAKRLYKRMAKGDRIEGAVSLGDMPSWGIAWGQDTNPSQVVIMQRLDGTLAENVAFQIAGMERFFRELDARRPSLLYVDEGHDFFTPTGSARGSDIVQRCYRAGRERGLATMAGFQRPKGINLQCLTEVNKCALFHIRYADDVKRLWDMGWPKREGAPTYTDYKAHIFKWWEGEPQSPRVRLGGNTRERKAS